MKETLSSKVIEDVRPYLDANGVIAPGSYGVTQAINNIAPNRVLGCRPPAISKRELQLPRKTRTVLSQLRSGFCCSLKDYQFRIGKSQDDICPLCLLEPETVRHIFDCPARPTQLVPDDLWAYPVDVASFLSAHPAFDVPPPPPARQRRGRPPPAPPPPPAAAWNYTLFSPISLPSFNFSFMLDSFSSLSLDSSPP